MTYHCITKVRLPGNLTRWSTQDAYDTRGTTIEVESTTGGYTTRRTMWLNDEENEALQDILMAVERRFDKERK